MKPKMSKPLAVVIPTWNNPQQLTWCVNSLFRYVDYPLHVYLVDNGGQGAVKKQLENVPTDLLTVLEPGVNLGWMGAHNFALEKIKEPYYCMMNDDVVFLPSHNTFFRRLTEHLQESRVGAVGPCSNFVAGQQSLMNIYTPLVFEVQFLIGFCMVARTEVLREVGAWDALLPGGDDLDLSIRLMDAGYSLRVDKTCYLHHIGQQTGVRLKGMDWDSAWSQEVTQNAIIRKHGLARWHKMMKCDWWEVPELKEATDEAR